VRTRDRTLERICRPSAQERPGSPLRGPDGSFVRHNGRIQYEEEPRCERCGKGYDPSFSFGRWCRDTCDRGAANRRLLILACSERKARFTEPIPAWHLYDGNLFRICKALLARGAWPGDVGVRILSAEHGLIRPDTPISWYDTRMTPDRARQLRGWASELHLAAFEEEAGEVYLAMGETYRLAVDGILRKVRIVDGGGQVGEMQAKLKDWLGDRPPVVADLFAA
jgi:hypothetical protein